MSNTLTEATLQFFETLQRKAPFNLQHISSRKRFLVINPVAKHCGFICPRVYVVYDVDIYLVTFCYVMSTFESVLFYSSGDLFFFFPIVLFLKL